MLAVISCIDMDWLFKQSSVLNSVDIYINKKM